MYLKVLYHEWYSVVGFHFIKVYHGVAASAKLDMVGFSERYIFVMFDATQIMYKRLRRNWRHHFAYKTALTWIFAGAPATDWSSWFHHCQQKQGKDVLPSSSLRYGRWPKGPQAYHLDNPGWEASFDFLLWLLGICCFLRYCFQDHSFPLYVMCHWWCWQVRSRLHWFEESLRFQQCKCVIDALL